MAHLVKPNAEAPEQWVNARTVAAHLNFGYQTILKMVDEGKIPGKPFRNGKKTFWRFKLSAIDAALTEQR